MMKKMFFLMLFLIASFGAFAQNHIKHTISKGDTITSLARKYGVKGQDIHTLNPGLINGIKLGEVILIPKMEKNAKLEKKEETSNNTTSPNTKEHKEFYGNGKVKEEGQLVYDDGEWKKQGEWKWYYENGQLETIQNYVNGKKHGEGKEYEKNGQLWLMRDYANGEVHGEQKEYENGQLKSKGNVVNGLRHGEWKEYDPISGKLKRTEQYENGDLKKVVHSETEQKTKSTNINIASSNEKKVSVSACSNYNIELGIVGTKYNVKTFWGVLTNNKTIVSLMESPASNLIKNQQMTTIGNQLINTNKATKNTTDLLRNELLSDRIIKDKKIYTHERVGNENNTIYFNFQYDKKVKEITLPNGADIPQINEYNLPPDKFELNSGNYIETFERKGGFGIGNHIVSFVAENVHDRKRYVFVYDYKNEKKYRKIDLVKATSVFSQSGKSCFQYKELKYKGILEYLGNPRRVPNYPDPHFCNVLNVVQNEDYIYIFLANGGWLQTPIIVRKSDYSVSVKNDVLFSDKEFNYLPFLKGFAHYHIDDTDKKNFNLEVYNSNMNKLWTKKLPDIQVTHVNDVNNFIIIGGYTENAGYKGFPNPKIIVIDKSTQQITYSKVITKKNASVNLITVDSDNNVVIAVGGYECCKAHDTDITFFPQVIIDKLNGSGKFVNDLFVDN